MINIAIFASGSGTNAERIIKYFLGSEKIKIKCVLTNNPKAFVIERARKLNIPHFTFSREDFYEKDRVVKILVDSDINFIVLAGFLWLVPTNFMRKFPKIINIHPALLPKYGGKGMYGMKIHEAVVENGESETGITIHWVNENYDEGEIILQKSVSIDPSDTPDDVAKKIHELEYAFYPKVIEKIAGNPM